MSIDLHMNVLQLVMLALCLLACTYVDGTRATSAAWTMQFISTPHVDIIYFQLGVKEGKEVKFSFAPKFSGLGHCCALRSVNWSFTGVLCRLVLLLNDKILQRSSLDCLWPLVGNLFRLWVFNLKSFIAFIKNVRALHSTGSSLALVRVIFWKQRKSSSPWQSVLENFFAMQWSPQHLLRSCVHKTEPCRVITGMVVHEIFSFCSVVFWLCCVLRKKISSLKPQWLLLALVVHPLQCGLLARLWSAKNFFFSEASMVISGIGGASFAVWSSGSTVFWGESMKPACSSMGKISFAVSRLLAPLWIVVCEKIFSMLNYGKK